MSFVRYMHSNTFSSAVASFSSLNDTCWWKLNCINLNNIWCINVHNLQVFVLFKKVFVFQRHKDILLCFFPKFLFLYLLHLDLQSIWSSFCLWNEVGMIFPPSRISRSSNTIYSKRPYLSNCTAVSLLS